jgi:hypothetical protein
MMEIYLEEEEIKMRKIIGANQDTRRMKLGCNVGGGANIVVDPWRWKGHGVCVIDKASVARA